MFTVLFVCTGNQFRSPIAAEVFRERLARDGRSGLWQVRSAGTWTSSGLHAMHEAVQLAKIFGVNIEGHRTQALGNDLLEEADAVLVMETGQKESIQVEFPAVRDKVHLLSEVIEGNSFDIPDPAAAPAEAREILRELVGMVRNGADRIYRLVEK
jgi:protein-tyrosine phosphatase